MINYDVTSICKEQYQCNYQNMLTVKESSATHKPSTPDVLNSKNKTNHVMMQEYSFTSIQNVSIFEH